MLVRCRRRTLIQYSTHLIHADRLAGGAKDTLIQIQDTFKLRPARVRKRQTAAIPAGAQTTKETGAVSSDSPKLACSTHAPPLSAPAGANQPCVIAPRIKTTVSHVS